MSKNVKVLKLITGEEIVAEVIKGSKEEYEYVIQNAFALIPTQAQNGGFSTMMAPWGIAVAGQIEIMGEHVVYAEEPQQKLKDKYESIVTGLVVPDKELIVG